MTSRITELSSVSEGLKVEAEQLRRKLSSEQGRFHEMARNMTAMVEARVQSNATIKSLSERCTMLQVGVALILVPFVSVGWFPPSSLEVGGGGGMEGGWFREGGRGWRSEEEGWGWKGVGAGGKYAMGER